MDTDFGVGGVTTLSASLRSAPPPEGEARDWRQLFSFWETKRLPLWGSCHAPA